MESATALGLAAPGRGLSVAIAADDQVTLRRMAATLSQEGMVAAEQGGPMENIGEDGAPAPSVAVLSCDVSKASRMTVLRRIRKRLPGTALVVIAPKPTGPAVRRAVEAGVDGFLGEAELEIALGVTVRAVAAGLTVVPRGQRGCTTAPAFSHREREVLGFVTEGLTNSQIADRLFLAESTVKSHLSSAFEKLGVRSRREAAALLLDPEDGLGAALDPVQVAP